MRKLTNPEFDASDYLSRILCESAPGPAGGGFDDEFLFCLHILRAEPAPVWPLILAQIGPATPYGGEVTWNRAIATLIEASVVHDVRESLARMTSLIDGTSLSTVLDGIAFGLQRLERQSGVDVAVFGRRALQLLRTGQCPDWYSLYCILDRGTGESQDLRERVRNHLHKHCAEYLESIDVVLN